jgi:hypothetical protein
MARRDSPRRKREKAEDIARVLLALQRTRGVLFADTAGLWLLSRPAPRPTNPSLLAASLLADLPSRTDLSNALGCEEATPLESGRVAKWEWALSHLSARRDLADLVREGVRPLRGYRGVDFPERFRTYRNTLDRFKGLLERAQAISLCQDLTQQDTLPVSVLVEALPARLSVLGGWPIDPVELLQRRDLPADGLLLDLARKSSDTALSALAAVLLGRRTSRSSPAERQKTAGQLPASLAGVFFEAAHSPVLQALAFSEGKWPLPPLVGIPGNECEGLLLAAERAALVFGVDVGLRVLDNLACVWQAAIDHTGVFRARLERFEKLLQARLRGEMPQSRSADEVDLTKNLRALNQAGQGGPRLLARLFVWWISSGGEHDGERYIGTRPLVRIAQGAWQAGPLAAVRALAEAWQKEATERLRKAQPTSSAAQRSRLELTVAHIDAALSIPPHLTEHVLAKYADWLADLPAERVRSVWPVLTALPDSAQRHPWRELVHSSLPAEVLARINRLEIAWPANALCNQPAAMVHYLDCVEALLAGNLPGVDVRAEWLVGLFRTGATCMPGVVLTLLRRTRAGQSGTEAEAALRALSQDLLTTGPLAEHARALSKALETWDTPVLTGPVDTMMELASVLEVEPAILQQYLHHRRLAGHSETFARTLLEPLDLANDEAKEAAFLTRRLADMPDDAPKRPYLVERLARLTDPVQVAARRVEIIAGARQRLQRSLELLRQESLERTLDDVYRTYLGRLLRKSIRPGPLPAGMREALALLHAENIDTRLLLSFLDDVLEGRSLRDREVNRTWLARAQSLGIDTQAWLAGVQATVEVNGEKITFATERDPLQVLRMGSYFETCLTLESGCNAASTLINALDVNKQVIYGRRGDGTVVARKLIGATVQGELAGYHTYGDVGPSPAEEACRQALGVILGDFARRCKLRLSDRATPEVLHQGFWYDDGNEAWLTAGQSLALPPPPPGTPQDRDAVREYHFALALESKETARLAALVQADEDDQVAYAGLYRLLLLDAVVGSEPAWTVPPHRDEEKVIMLLAQRGSFHWLDRAESQFSHGQAAWRLETMLANLPWNQEVVVRAIKRLKQALQRKEMGRFNHGTHLPPKASALASMEELVEMYEAMMRFQCQNCQQESRTSDAFVSAWADRLQMVWLRDREPRPLVRALTSDVPGLREVVIELACREVIPGVAPALRDLLAASRADALSAALALGTQADCRDGPRLLALLQERPRSLPLAVAVVRTTDNDSAEAARQLWRPLSRIPSQDVNLGQLRELASPRLARQLRGEIKDRARTLAMQGWDAPTETSVELRDLLRKVALLGYPGQDGDPAALMVPYLGERLFLEVFGWNAQVERDLEQVWHDTCRIAAEVEKLQAGEAAPLGSWRNLRARVRDWPGYTLIDDRFSRVLRQIAARRDDPRRTEAIAILLGMDGQPEQAEVSRLLPLVSDELADLPWAMRDQAALVLWKGASFDTTSVSEVLAWLAGRSWGQPEGLLERTGEQLGALQEIPGLALLLALESSDMGEMQAATTVLEMLARHVPENLLGMLDLAFHWLRPEVIEPVAEELAQPLAASNLTASRLMDWLAGSGRSFRWQRWALRLLQQHPDFDRDSLQRRLRTDQENPRAAWLLGMIEEKQPEGAAEE